MDYDKRLMLFAGRSHPALAASIARRLGVGLGPVQLETYANGEVYCRFDESVRGADVFVVQSLCGTRDGALSINDAFMELILLVDAAVGASAHRVIPVIPWFGYSRQDKKSLLREPISARAIARMLESARVDRVLTVDLHTGQAQGFFSAPVDHMTATILLAQQLQGSVAPDTVVVAPDAGRVKLAKKFATRLGTELAILDPESTERRHAVIGEVAGRTAIVVDDIIDTGGTLSAAVGILRDAGVASIRAVAVHPILSGDTLQRLGELGLDEVLVTDTVPLPVGLPPWMRVVGCADLLADTIHRIFTDDSVSEAFGGENIRG
ncbi:ribose-phosphate pyrophosphokinase [Baekduia soli]|uniref:ribose-phosphate diphosphokinase n=1 Tax=Baekduia soli TaxID=496014 RepID=A0A5B8UCU2_9ACTN|nr:ribose-phosphate pyrophosphokinase [Baekduia soli]